MSGSPDRRQWRKIDGILEEALEKDPADRLGFVSEACGDDEAVLSRVLDLLSALDEVGSFLETPMEAMTLGFWDEVLSAEPVNETGRAGEIVGSYRLLHEIGRGGMGSVYLAERADQEFEREVAIKVLRSDLDTDSVVGRFLAERQILASLRHPNIAQLLDGGTASDGRPYLVMEYVPGTRIDRHCDRRRMSVRQRLELFLEVLGAVEHAHRNLIVHRDLKPSNIFVSEEDGSIKLLDFGIAKIMDPSRESGDEAMTQAGSRFLTPGYAAPEQLLGERVRVEADVYALTAVLYELLTGVRPYAESGNKSVLERVVSGRVPRLASEVAAWPGGVQPTSGGSHSTAAGETARRRSSNPQALRRALRGDLDAILSRGLRAQPDERYGSVHELRGEIGHFLQGRPVRARGDALLYSTRKFLRRHWLEVAGAAGFVLLLAGSALGLALQQGAVLRERDRAEAEAQKATQVTDLLVDIFASSDPRQQLGDSVSARTLLERGVVRLEDELSDQPEVHAELLDAIGQAFTGLGSYEMAVPLHERSVDLRRNSVEGTSSALAESLLLLGEANQKARDFELAIEVYREGLAANPGTTRDDSLTLGFMASGLGTSLRGLGELEEAEEWIRQAVDVVDALAEAEQEALDVRVSLAGLLNARGKKAEAERLYLQILAGQRELLGPDHPHVAVTLNNLGYVLRTGGRNREAAHYYRQSTEALAEIYGRGHPETLMIAGNLATAISQDGDHDGSAEVYRENILAAERQWPDGHWRLAREFLYYGATLLKAGRAAEAVEPLQRSVEVSSEVRGWDHPETRVFQAWLGTGLELSGRTAEAGVAFQQAATALASSGALNDDRVARGMLGALVRDMNEMGVSAAEVFASLLE